MFDVEITRMALAVEDPDQLARVSLTRSAIAPHSNSSDKRKISKQVGFVPGV